MPKLLSKITWLALLGAWFGLVCSPEAVRATEKPAVIAKVLEVMQVLRALSEKEMSHQGEEDFGKNLNKKVEPILQPLSTAELEKIAVISRDIYFPGDAEDVDYDATFYNSYWASVDLIAGRVHPESLRSLEFIRSQVRPDGGERTMYDYVMEEFQKKLDAAKKGGSPVGGEFVQQSSIVTP